MIIYKESEATYFQYQNTLALLLSAALVSFPDPPLMGAHARGRGGSGR